MLKSMEQRSLQPVMIANASPQAQAMQQLWQAHLRHPPASAGLEEEAPSRVVMKGEKSRSLQPVMLAKALLRGEAQALHCPAKEGTPTRLARKGKELRWRSLQLVMMAKTPLRG